jgi:hypothetical protein
MAVGETLSVVFHGALRPCTPISDPYRRQLVYTESEKKMLADIKAGLKPPSKEELDQVTAKWLFGENAEKMMRHAPWSFVLLKVMWKKGEEPWAS